jgi:hypothetical protein
MGTVGRGFSAHVMEATAIKNTAIAATIANAILGLRKKSSEAITNARKPAPYIPQKQKDRI